MEKNFVDNIVEKIINKTNVTGRYKSAIGEIDSNQSNSKIIVSICEKLFNKIWDENQEIIVPVYERIMEETGDKDIISDDYLGRNQVFELTQGKEQELYKIIAPLLGIMKNFSEQMPEEMKLVLLVDCFNTIAHNLQLVFGSKLGEQFWFDLKNDVLIEMIKRFDKNSVYISKPNDKNIVSISFKVKMNDEVDFFSWHSTSDIFTNIPDFKLARYQNPKLKKAIKAKGKSDLTGAKLYNHQLYNYIFQHCEDYEKQISDVFSVELKAPDTSLAYEGGGTYDEQKQSQEKYEFKEMSETEKKISKLFAEIENADSQEKMENVIKNSSFSKLIDKLQILKLRGRYPIYYAKINFNGNEVVIKCREGFKCDKYIGKCYTRAEVEQMGTTEIFEIAQRVDEKSDTKIEEMSENNTNIEEDSSNPSLEETDKIQYTTATDMNKYVSEEVMKQYLELIGRMSPEQKAMLVGHLLASSSEMEIGEIVKKLFVGNPGGNRRNGGPAHE